MSGTPCHTSRDTGHRKEYYLPCDLLHYLKSTPDNGNQKIAITRHIFGSIPS